MIEIQLQLPIYLVKYLKTLYGEPYSPMPDDEIGIYILNILERKTSLSEPVYSFQRKSNVTYTLCINEHNFTKRGCLIPTEKQSLIVKYVDSHFRKEIFRSAVLNYHYYQIPYKKTIITALKTYNITENDLSYETIRKDFNRKKGKIEEKLIFKSA